MNLITAAAIALLKESEGFCADNYTCPSGFQTIGYGHRILPGEHFETPMSEAQAEALMRDDLAKAEAAVQRLVKVPLSNNQYSALVLFTYNLGEQHLKESTLLRLLNQFHYYEAAQEFDKWVFAGKKKLPGLVKRRTNEKALFLTEEDHVDF